MIADKLAAKILLIACFGLVSACSLVFMPKAKATTILGNIDAMQKPCGAGFTRTAPRYCASDTVVGTSFVWVDTVACTARQLGGAGLNIPAGSFVDLRVIWNIKSNNAIAQRTNFIAFYNAAGCATTITGTSITAREFAAVVAGTNIYTIDSFVFNVPIVTLPGQVYFTQANAGGNGNGDIQETQIIGYTDAL